MNLESTKGKKTISFPAEILPKNANTEKILKIREEQEAARKAKEDAVSNSLELHTSLRDPSFGLRRFHHLLHMHFKY